MKIALFSPLHPMKSGIADYTEEMLPDLGQYFDIDLYLEPRYVSSRPAARPAFRVFAFRPDSFVASQYDAIVYHMGNYYPAHRFIYEALRRHPGIVVLHDFVLQGFYARRAEVEGKFEEYRKLLETHYGKDGVEIAESVARRVQPPIWETEESLNFPLNEEILELATAVIVHSDFVRERVEEKAAVPVVKIPHHGHVLKAFDRNTERKAWGVGPDDILVSSIGFVNRNRRYEYVIEALEGLADSRLRYVIAGEDRGQLLRDWIADSPARVFVEGFLPFEKMESLISASDICVNLRYPTMGESSGTLLRQMGYARPTLITDCGSYAEIPDWAAIKVAPDIDEPALLRAYLAVLIQDQDLRLSVGREAAAYVRSECDLKECVRSYAKFIAAVAGGLNKPRPTSSAGASGLGKR